MSLLARVRALAPDARHVPPPSIHALIGRLAPMKGYVGQCRGEKMIALCNASALGEATQPKEYPPRRTPWFFDNGAYADWQNAKPFNERAYLAGVERIAAGGPRPDFIVVPDRVADPSSLEWSLSWLPRVRGVAPLAFVVQNGMEEGAVRAALRVGPFSTLFVGGSLDWKLDTPPQWVRVGGEERVRVHVGRMGTARRVVYARQCGADSVDSCTPLWSVQKLSVFVRALTCPIKAGTPPEKPPAKEMRWKEKS